MMYFVSNLPWICHHFAPPKHVIACLRDVFLLFFQLNQMRGVMAPHQPAWISNYIFDRGVPSVLILYTMRVVKIFKGGLR